MIKKFRDFFALERNVAAIAATNIIWIAGIALWIDFLPKYFQSLGASIAIVGSLFSLHIVLTAIFHALGGYLSDLYGRKKIYVISLAIGTIPILIYFAAPYWTFLIPGIFLLSFSDGVNQTSDSILVTESLSKKKRATGRATIHIIGIAAAAVFFPIGGMIVQNFGINEGVKIGLLISSLVVPMSAIFANSFLKETLQKRLKKPKFDFSLIPVISFLKKMPSQVKYLIFSRMFSLFAWSLIETYFIFYALDIIKIQPIEWGILTSVGVASFGLFTFLGAKISDRYGRKYVILTLFSAAAITPLLYIASTSFYHLALVQIFAGLLGIGLSSIDAYTADYTPKKIRGRSIGTANSLFTISMIPGPLVGGILFSIFPQAPFIVSAFVGFVSIILGWKLLR
jgi:MFS family permease